jgi:hypothetical protein
MIDLSSVLSQVISMKRDLALARGGVDAAVAQEIFDLLVQPAEAMLLSRNSASAGMPVALAVFDALSRNRPVSLGESTGLQVLSRSIPGEDGSLGDLREKMIALASWVDLQNAPCRKAKASNMGRRPMSRWTLISTPPCDFTS